MKSGVWQQQIEELVQKLEEAKGSRIEAQNRQWLTHHNLHFVINVSQNEEHRLKNALQIVYSYLETDAFGGFIVAIQNGKSVTRQDISLNKELLFIQENKSGQCNIFLYDPTKEEA